MHSVLRQVCADPGPAKLLLSKVILLVLDLMGKLRAVEQLGWCMSDARDDPDIGVVILTGQTTYISLMLVSTKRQSRCHSD